MTAEELIVQVMRLPKDQRLELADMIYDSVEDAEDEEIDPEWAAEIRRRVDGLKAGTRKTLSWDDAMRHIRGQDD
jgi:putative addiction module component (TIGR02574 family)